MNLATVRGNRGELDELVEAELGAYMAAHRSTFDIIVCCDTSSTRASFRPPSRPRPSRCGPVASYRIAGTLSRKDADAVEAYLAECEAKALRQLSGPPSESLAA
jgi:hypothetical protein